MPVGHPEPEHLSEVTLASNPDFPRTDLALAVVFLVIVTTGTRARRASSRIWARR
jgi:hypothetical protein